MAWNPDASLGTIQQIGPSSSFVDTRPDKNKTFKNEGRYFRPSGGLSHYPEAAAEWRAAGYELDPTTGYLAQRSNSGSTQNFGASGVETTIGGMFGATLPPTGGTSIGTTEEGNRFESGLSSNEARLKALLDDPESIQQTASYKFRLKQGEDALQRQLGAKGLLNSGNRLMELTKYGQDMGSQEYDAQHSRLSDLIGKYATGWTGVNQQNISREKNIWGAQSDRENAITGRYNAETARMTGNLGATRQQDSWAAEQQQIKMLRDINEQRLLYG